MRLFVAAGIPANVRDELSSQVSALSAMKGVRWLAPELLHVTLKFLGETDPARLGAVQKTIEGSTATRSFGLRIEKGGVFPSLREPMIFWAGLSGETDQLVALASGLESGFRNGGFEIEPRPYRPHLTLGRTASGVRLNRAASEKFLAALGDFRSDPFKVKEIHLLRSHLSSTGSRYETLRTFPLA